MEREEDAELAANLSQKEVDKALSEAKEAWEQDAEARLARVREAWESELTQRMAEAQEEWEAKEEELTAITQRALDRAKLAEQSASLAKRLTKQEEAGAGAGKTPRKVKRKARSGPSPFRIERPGRMLALACVTLAILLYANLAPGLDLGPVIKRFDWLSGKPESKRQEETQARWFIQPPAVNVRMEASPSAPVVTRLTRAAPVVEVKRRGDWVQIEIPDSAGLTGWIHGSLLALEPAE